MMAEIPIAERKVIISPSIDDLQRQVPEGETRLFERPRPDVVEERFFAVHMSWDYKPGRLTWHNKPPLEQTPWNGSRTTPRIPVTSVPDPDVTFDGPLADLVDFYSTGTDASFISKKLAALIENIDPNSLDRRTITISARDGSCDFIMVMGARNLEAVDPARTDVLIKDKDYGRWLRSIQFPTGVVFHDGLPIAIHSFTDIDVRGWFWSRTLIEEAKAAGIKGLYTMLPGRVSGPTLDNL